MYKFNVEIVFHAKSAVTALKLNCVKMGVDVTEIRQHAYLAGMHHHSV